MLMLDAVTGERLLVRDTEFGPCIVVHSFEDVDFIEDAFVEQYDVETSFREVAAGECQRSFELFLRSHLSRSELQGLLDSMSYERQKTQPDIDSDATPSI